MKLDTLYQNSPIFIQNLMCSAYGLVEKNKRYSKYFFEYLDWLEESQYWGEKEIYEYKLRELQRIYRHAFETVPYYSNRFKKAGLSRDTISEIEDFKKVPVLEKKIFMIIGKLFSPVKIQMENYILFKPVVHPVGH